jgi:hypothetical protein
MFSKMVDPWSETVGLLKILSGYVDRCALPRQTLNEPSSCKRKGHYDRASLSIRVTGRPTRTTATLDWRHTNNCCYSDQLWRHGVARKGGICLLSGRSIVRGDEIYHPHAGNRAPVNADAMILAVFIEGTPTGDELDENFSQS